MNLNLLDYPVQKTKPNLDKRIKAALIDYGILIVVEQIFEQFWGHKHADGHVSLQNFAAFAYLAFWFLYTVGIEQWKGATWGNQLMHLKPLPLHQPNGKLKLSQSIKRHLLDIIDLSFMGLVGYLSIKNSKYNQRVGDKWGKTVVIDLDDPEQILI
ncbi:MAG TPA: RDD family protein [Cytophagales bacterium]|nr:RDD family protein [Cytophagales bacterium]